MKIQTLEIPISFAPKGRPCIVTRLHRNEPPEEIKAFFYGLFQWSEMTPPNSKKDKTEAQMDVRAMVELENGEFRSVAPGLVRLLDSPAKFAEYAWDVDVVKPPRYPSEKKKPVDAPPLNCQGCKYWPKPTTVGTPEPCCHCGGVLTGYKYWEPNT